MRGPLVEGTFAALLKTLEGLVVETPFIKDKTLDITWSLGPPCRVLHMTWDTRYVDICVSRYLSPHARAQRAALS